MYSHFSLLPSHIIMTMNDSRGARYAKGEFFVALRQMKTLCSKRISRHSNPIPELPYDIGNDHASEIEFS